MTDKQLLQQAFDALIIAEAGLSDIGDADREPGDDVAWCEARAAQALRLPRNAIVALRAAIAQPAIKESLTDQPACYQFQTIDGNWHGFSDEKHFNNTVAFDRWPIRALYTHPIAQPEQTASITHDDWYAKCNMVDALKDKVFALNAKCEVRDEIIVNLRNAYAQAIAQPEQPNQALQAIARLLQVHEGRNPEDALKIAAAMIGAQPVQPALTDAQFKAMCEKQHAESIAEWTHPAEPAAVEQTDPVAWQWLDTGTFRKTLPKTAVVADWSPLFKNSAAIAQPKDKL